MLGQSGKRRKSYIFLITSVFLLALACNSGSKGLTIVSRLPLSAYTEARYHANGDKTGFFYFPALEVYDKNGICLYSSHDAEQNSELLRNFPASVQNKSVQAGMPNLKSIVDAFPAFRSQREKIIGKNELVILSVSLEGCGGCAIQDDALERIDRSFHASKKTALLKIDVISP